MTFAGFARLSALSVALEKPSRCRCCERTTPSKAAEILHCQRFFSTSLDGCQVWAGLGMGMGMGDVRYAWKADVRRGKRQACYDHGCPQRRHQFNVPDSFKSSRRSVLFGAAFSSSTWLRREGRPRRGFFGVGKLNSLRRPRCLALLDSHWEAPHHSCSASAFFCEEKTLQRN